MIRLLISFLLILIFSPGIQAATHTAASGAYADVLTAYNAASPGDTVAIPVDTVAWNSETFTISKEIKIQGAGISGTTITSNSTNTLMEIALTSDVPVEITGIYFQFSANNTGGQAIRITGKTDGSFAYTQVRIHNCYFEKGTATIRAKGWVEGLIDNNTFVNCNEAVLVLGDNNHSWGRTIEPGTSNALFIEDNTFIVDNDTDREPNEQIYHQEGGRTVIRHNTFDGTAYTSGGNTLFIDTHGNWPYYDDVGYAYRGQPIIEIYNNIFTGYQSYRYFNFRGGSILFYNNTITVTIGSAQQLKLTEEESWQTAHFTPLDSVWPAEDQITNCFFWNNTSNGSGVTVVPSNANDPTFIQNGRDYFLAAPTTSGGSTFYNDRAGAAGNAADGTLCHNAVGANAYYPYTAYSYPHPLQGGSIAMTGKALTEEFNEDDIAGGTSGYWTIVFNVTGDTFISSLTQNNAFTDLLLDSIVSDRSLAHGWNNEVSPLLDYTLTELSADRTGVTVYVPQVPAYDLEQTEENVGASSLSGLLFDSGVTKTPTPSSFPVGYIASPSPGGSGIVGQGMVHVEGGKVVIWREGEKKIE